jgi:MSHA pilin protein MshD
MTIVIISVGLTGTMLGFKMAAQFSSDPIVEQQAVSIAKSYLEEIMQKNFPTTLPCPAPPAGGRQVYTNICDYNNLVNVGARGQDNALISGLGMYTVSVTLDTATAVFNALASGTQVVRIDVTVSHISLPQGIKLSGYRTNY